jgi:putative endonuclease
VPYYCYLLECRDGTYYCGITTDREKRLKQHNQGSASKYTRSRRPVKMVYCEEQTNRSTAMRREREIKKFPRLKKKELIKGYVHDRPSGII